jgi:hypothetical protein
MKPARTLSTLVVCVAATASMLMSQAAPLLAQQAAQEASAAATPTLTPAQMEAFLLHARIVSSRKIGKGVTGSRVATLSDGRLTHDAHIQDVNIEKRNQRNFRDHYRYNIAAYRVSRLLGLTNVPMSVERHIDRTPAAVTWWIDDTVVDEEERLARVKKNTTPPEWQPARAVGYVQTMYVFDELIANADRNAGNQLWTNDGTLWLIDHTRAFRLQHRLKQPQRLERCPRALWTALQALTVESVTASVEYSLTKDEINALIARRDLIVTHFSERIAARGEDAILYSPAP